MSLFGKRPQPRSSFLNNWSGEQTGRSGRELLDRVIILNNNNFERRFVWTRSLVHFSCLQDEQQRRRGDPQRTPPDRPTGRTID